MIDLVFKNSTSDKKFNSRFFEKILAAAIKELKFGKKNIDISVNLVEEGKIKELNKKYRGKNKVTDVLSFPMDYRYKIQNTKYKILDLGDIFICLSFAKKQAKSENISIEKELARLTVHGFLHLAGYDHEKSGKDEARMFKLESKILGRLNTQ